MQDEAINIQDWKFHPATPERWPDLAALFGERGAFSGCWCLWWRVTRSEFSRMTNPERKQGLKRLVESGQPPGLLGYVGGTPVGWCSVGPRESFASLERSRKLKRIDAQPVWSVVCLFVDKRYRGQGAATKLLQAAVAYAAANGAQIVEGYPATPKARSQPVDVFMGPASAFREAGFVKVQADPLIMRYTIASSA
jgi:GNAT superfamily N-acetyltransferase